MNRETESHKKTFRLIFLTQTSDDRGNFSGLAKGNNELRRATTKSRYRYRIAIPHKGLRVSGGMSASRIEFTLGNTRASNMHTGNFESAPLPGNLRQDGVYMTNDRIPYAKKSTLPRRLLSSLPFPRSLHPYFVHSKRRRARARVEYTYNARRELSLVSPFPSLSRVISHPRRYYERACNGNRRMIHGDVKRDGSRCRLETQSLPIPRAADAAGENRASFC